MNKKNPERDKNKLEDILRDIEERGHRSRWLDKDITFDINDEDIEEVLNNLRNPNNQKHTSAGTSHNASRKDGPTYIYTDGTQEWCDGHMRHRIGAPAVIKADGTEEWWVEGQRHREDGPAETYPNGTEIWSLHGERHREDGPAATYSDGTKEWYQHDQLHRVDGPAITEPDGTEEWWMNGQLHREDGPAAIYTSEDKVEYHYHGRYYPDIETDFEWEALKLTGVLDNDFEPRDQQ